MTHYWWMHWFWITTINFNGALLFGGYPTQSVSSPFVYAVLNGHQNGPYTTITPEQFNGNDKVAVAEPDTEEYISFTTSSSSTVSPSPSPSPISSPSPSLSSLTEPITDPIVFTSTTAIKTTSTTITSIIPETSSTEAIGSTTDATDASTHVVTTTTTRTSTTALGMLTDIATYNNSSNRVSLSSVGHNIGTGLNAVSITGIAFGIITSAALVGAVSFVIYRRRHLNKPQALDDSNPDSSGYLDDTTLRETSEEMYSLDNDSFLNSLEAMTIPNYWTDSVKHTKL